MSKKSKKAKKATRRVVAAPVTDYHERLALDQLEVHNRAIDAFIRDYKKAPSSPNRQTLFFFPGGMASQLWRSTQRFADGKSNPPFDYKTKMWLNCQSLLWRARQLGMKRQSVHLFRDRDDYIVLADGAVNLNGRTPHDGLIKWCKANHVDLFVFNWDWRRRQEETARFFVERFWPLFKKRVEDARIGEAARDFSLLGHSFGGMIVNLILRGGDAQVSQKLRHAITAATPFYGYAGQAHRWFEGETFLNGDGKGELVEIVKVINSLPGLYVLHYLDQETYKRDRAALEADREFPLRAYPNVDAQKKDEVDPWRQQMDANRGMRYPESMGFDERELEYARSVFRHLASPLQDNRFYNMRGVRVGEDGKTLNNTVGSVTCDWIGAKFDPQHDDCPIKNAGKVPGDDTQPAWTTRLVGADERCITIKHKNLSHMFLMSNENTLTELGRILLGPRAAPTVEAAPLLRFASDDEMGEFRAWLYKYGQQKSAQQPSEAEIRREMPKKLKRKLPAIARRVLEEILKRPDAMH